MARKTMVREVTYTTVKVAKMEVVDGRPVATPLDDLTLIGNVSQEKAQREAQKEYGKGASVFEVTPNTHKYEMALEDFIKHATLIEE